MPAATARPTLETCLRVLFRTAAFPLGMRDRHRILLHRVNLSKNVRAFRRLGEDFRSQSYD